MLPFGCALQSSAQDAAEDVQVHFLHVVCIGEVYLGSSCEHQLPLRTICSLIWRSVNLWRQFNLTFLGPPRLAAQRMLTSSAPVAYLITFALMNGVTDADSRWPCTSYGISRATASGVERTV